MQLTLGSRRPETPALILGRYRLGEVIGRGGMSTVHHGVDVTTGTPAAIKLLAAHLSDDDVSRHRLLAEARAISRLPHPHIVRLIDWGATPDGAVVLVMELVEGETLARRLQRGPLSIADAVSVARQIAEALACAHGQGIVHRDVKPHNILLAAGTTPAGPESRPADCGLRTADLGPAPLAKLADFGIARSEDATAAYTTTGLVMGSAPYLAPELLRGWPASPQSDLYSLGVTLFQMLTGRLPFETATAAESLTRRLVADAPRLRTLLPIAPPWLDGTVAALLARDPARRPRDAASVAARLGHGEAPTGRVLPRWEWPTKSFLAPRASFDGASVTKPLARPRRAPAHPLPTAARRRAPAPRSAVYPVHPAERPAPFRRRREQRRLPLVAAALLAVFVLLAASAAALGPRRATARTPSTGQSARPNPAGGQAARPNSTVASPAPATDAPPAAPTAAPTEAPPPTAQPTPVPPAPQARFVPAPAKGHEKPKRH